MVTLFKNWYIWLCRQNLLLNFWCLSNKCLVKTFFPFNYLCLLFFLLLIYSNPLNVGNIILTCFMDFVKCLLLVIACSHIIFVMALHMHLWNKSRRQLIGILFICSSGNGWSRSDAERWLWSGGKTPSNNLMIKTNTMFNFYIFNSNLLVFATHTNSWCQLRFLHHLHHTTPECGWLGNMKKSMWFAVGMTYLLLFTNQMQICFARWCIKKFN